MSSEGGESFPNSEQSHPSVNQVAVEYFSTPISQDEDNNPITRTDELLEKMGEGKGRTFRSLVTALAERKSQKLTEKILPLDIFYAAHNPDDILYEEEVQEANILAREVYDVWLTKKIDSQVENISDEEFSEGIEEPEFSY